MNNDGNYDGSHGVNYSSTASERFSAGVMSTDTSYTAQVKVENHRNRDLAYTGGISASSLALDAALKRFFKFVGILLLCGVVLGLLACGGVLAVNANRIAAERDPLHGGIGRSLLEWKLSDRHLPPGEPDFGLQQMAQAIHGGLPAITGKRILKLNKAEVAAGAELAYRCILSDRCWAEVQASPALDGMLLLAEHAVRKLENSADAGPMNAALVELRIYRGSKPATDGVNLIAGLHRRHPDSAGLAAMNAQVQHSWLLTLTAWAEKQAEH
jgi:hypothetical protein